MRSPTHRPLDIYRGPQPGTLYGGPVYPGNGYPENPNEDRAPGSAWGRLKLKQNAGKKSVIKYNNTAQGIQWGDVPMFQLQGDDFDAQQLLITIASPSVIPIPYEDLAIVADQNLTGETTNLQADNVHVGNFPGTSEPVAFPPIQAEIEWGVGGTYARAIVDVINGATIAVVASFVKARAFIYTPTARSIDGTAAAYVVGGFVGPGYARPGHAQCTMYVGAIAAGTESALVPVPPFAKKAYVFGCDGRVVSTPAPALTTATLRFWQSKSGFANELNVGNANFTGNQPSPCLVPNAAQFCSVVNGTSASLLFNVVFELSI